MSIERWSFARRSILLELSVVQLERGKPPFPNAIYRLEFFPEVEC